MIMTTVLAIDIETGGCMVGAHPLIAIGTYLITPDLKEAKRFTFKFDLKDFEKRCYDEFWSKHLDKLQHFKDSPTNTIQEFANYVDSLDEKYPNLIILTDNAAYDIGFINYYYAKELQRKPLQYKKNGSYRVITDTDSFYYALLPNPTDNWVWSSKIQEKFQIDVKDTKTHYPEEDAQYIASLFVEVMKKLTG